MNFSLLRNLNSLHFEFHFFEHIFSKNSILVLSLFPSLEFVLFRIILYQIPKNFFTFSLHSRYIYLQPLSSSFESIKTIAHFACVLLDSLIKWYVSCVYIGARDPSRPLPLISLARSSPSQTVA